MQAKVSAPTRAGRALRRSLLKGCVVVIVVAGYSGKRFVYERAHELGIRCRPRLTCLVLVMLAGAHATVWLSSVRTTTHPVLQTTPASGGRLSLSSAAEQCCSGIVFCCKGRMRVLRCRGTPLQESLRLGALPEQKGYCGGVHTEGSPTSLSKRG